MLIAETNVNFEKSEWNPIKSEYLIKICVSDFDETTVIPSVYFR